LLKMAGKNASREAWEKMIDIREGGSPRGEAGEARSRYSNKGETGREYRVLRSGEIQESATHGGKNHKEDLSESRRWIK